LEECPKKASKEYPIGLRRNKGHSSDPTRIKHKNPHLLDHHIFEVRLTFQDLVKNIGFKRR